MADVRLTIAGRAYTLACQPGEEPQIIRLGAMVDRAARRANASAPGLTEVRSLLFAALLLADELCEMSDKLASEFLARDGTADAPAPGGAPGDLLSRDNESEMAARAIEHLAVRIEKLAISLEQMAEAS